MISKGVVNKVSSLPEVINKAGSIYKVVQLFCGPIFWLWFYPFGTLKHWSISIPTAAWSWWSLSTPKAASSQQYIYPYKIQSIMPNTFTNEESIPHKESLHNQLKKNNHFPQLFGGRGGGYHFPTLFRLGCMMNDIGWVAEFADSLHWWAYWPL